MADRSGADPKISIVVCTHNRARLLKFALESLCNQSLSKDSYEIVVVDNNSTDCTREVVESFATAGNVRYFFEARQGLSRARNAGWQSARGAVVGFMDDDSKAPPDWLAAAMAIVEENRFKVFGGPIYPFYNVERPAWYKDSYDKPTFGYIDAPFVFTDKWFLDGGNLFLAKDLLRLIDGFHTDFGMAGNKIVYGEETDLQMRLRDKLPGIESLCDPRLLNYHLVRQEKMSLWWYVRDQFARGINSAMLYPDSLGNEGKRSLLLFGFKGILEVLKRTWESFFQRNREEFPFWQNYVREKTSDTIIRLGRIYCYLKDDNPAR